MLGLLLIAFLQQPVCSCNKDIIIIIISIIITNKRLYM